MASFRLHEHRTTSLSGIHGLGGDHHTRITVADVAFVVLLGATVALVVTGNLLQALMVVIALMVCWVVGVVLLGVAVVIDRYRVAHGVEPPDPDAARRRFAARRLSQPQVPFG